MPDHTWEPDDQGLVAPQAVPLDQFPHSTATAEGVQVINAALSEPSVTMHLGVCYATKSGMDLHLQVIEPRQGEDEALTFPLILFVQGSAWHQQNLGASLGSLARFAQRGYVIAVVEYRPSDVEPFPAQVADCKTAVRWMRAHAAEFHADPSSIYLWGDSSGGHTVVMTGLTLDDPTTCDEDPAADPIAIQGVIDYYGPTDISTMCREPSTMDHVAPDSPEGMLIGGHNVLDRPDLVAPTVTSNRVSPHVDVPSFLILHGSKDRLVPYGQSVLLYKALVAAGKDVACYQLYGADHGGSAFWTKAVLDIVEEFVRRNA